MIPQKKYSPNLIKRLFLKIKSEGLLNTTLLIFKKLANRIDSPGNLFKPTLRQRNLLIKFRKIILLNRFKKAKEKRGIIKNNSVYKIEKDKGYKLISSDNISLEELRQSLLNQFNIETDSLEEFEQRSSLTISGKGTPIIPINSDHINNNELLLRFLTSDQIISSIAEYIGVMPWLYSADIWLSRASETIENSSQHFHMDWEDQKIVKLFFFLDDITEHHGPFCLINKEDTQRVIDHYDERYKSKIVSQRLSDDEVYKVVDKEKLIKLTGPKNSIALVDTCNILHFGSRPSRFPRKMMACMYASPFSIQNYIFQKSKFSKTMTNEIDEPLSWVINH